MAEIMDGDLEVDKGEIEAVEEQTEQKAAEDGLPSNLKGKTVSELAKMYQDAERLIGRQSAEVSEVRKLADELIKSQLNSKPQVEAPKEVDFFENPQEAIRQQIENSPKVLAAEQYAKQMQQEQAKMRLNQAHPDMAQVVQDPEFRNWVQASKVRSKLFQQADEYDVEAADELLSTFKELRQVKQQRDVKVDTVARDRSLRSAAVDTGGSGETSKKIYRRSDILKMMMHNRSEYDSRADEFSRAYSEGRVK